MVDAHTKRKRQREKKEKQGTMITPPSVALMEGLRKPKTATKKKSKKKKKVLKRNPEEE